MEISLNVPLPAKKLSPTFNGTKLLQKRSQGKLNLD